MIRGDYQFIADCVTKFHDFIYINGWFVGPDTLADLRLVGAKPIPQVSKTRLDYPGIGPAAGFRLEALLSNGFDWDLEVEFRTTKGIRFRATVRELSDDRFSHYPSRSLYERFRDTIKGHPKCRVLDLGGRDRSHSDLSLEYPGVDYVVLDILPGDNVDIVGDAHMLSKLIEPETFDYVISVSVFEHLLMPWKVAIEVNRILKPGGLAMIQSHQTLGLHDVPWDFWRISDTGWDGLFNQSTGFSIVERVMDFPQFVVPFVIRDEKLMAERAAGFDLSGVTIQKIGPAQVHWDVDLNAIIDTAYPKE